MKSNFKVRCDRCKRAKDSVKRICIGSHKQGYRYLMLCLRCRWFRLFEVIR